ncbi:MAG: TlpA disulfide reductase family protein [Pirellulales bacterium]
MPRREDDPPAVMRPDSLVGVDLGCEAPDIQGDDLDGQPLTLHEFRGQVVVLVFWAHWCILCREQFAHHHDIVERYRGRPLVMLGVNCDPERSLIERENGPRGINWRSWWDGVAVGGPVSVAWRLDGLPGIVLIDHNGTVRRRNLRGTELDQAIEELVRAVPVSPPDAL